MKSLNMSSGSKSGSKSAHLNRSSLLLSTKSTKSTKPITKSPLRTTKSLYSSSRFSPSSNPSAPHRNRGSPAKNYNGSQPFGDDDEVSWGVDFKSNPPSRHRKTPTPASTTPTPTSDRPKSSHPSGLTQADIVTVPITDLTHEGHGVAKLSAGFPLFIPEALPGEVVEARVVELKKTWGKGQMRSIVEQSPDRIEPPCVFFSKCGGCALQHLDYKAQLDWKHKMVSGVVKRIGKLNEGIVIKPVIGMDDPWRYRNKIQIPIGVATGRVNGGRGFGEKSSFGQDQSLDHRGGSGWGRDDNNNNARNQRNPRGQQREKKGLVTGFYSARSHDVIDVDECLIGPSELDTILTEFTDYCNEIGLEPYDEESHSGVLRHIVMRKANGGGSSDHTKKIGEDTLDESNVPDTSELMLILVTKTNYLPSEDLIIDKIVRRFPNIRSIYHNVNPERTNVVLGRTNRLLWGHESIQDKITIDVGGNDEKKQQEQQEQQPQQQDGDDQQSSSTLPTTTNPNNRDLIFDISPNSFFQVNPIQTTKLYQKVIEYAQLKSNTIAIDAYCGVGTISLAMSLAGARHIFGVEVIPDAINDAKRNATRNGLGDKIYFEAGKAEEVIPQWYRQIPDFRADVIILDPPRKGCEPELINTIIERGIERVVYVSCSPATLARDLALFEGGIENVGNYRTVEITPIDMFPHTYHCEAVAVLEFQPALQQQEQRLGEQGEGGKS